MAQVSVCNCKHESQDKIYGQGKRLFNVAKDGQELRCTVCNNIRKVGSTEKK